MRGVEGCKKLQKCKNGGRRRRRSPAGRPQVASFHLRAQPAGLPRMEVSHALGGPGVRPTATVAQGFRWHRVCALFQPKSFRHMCSSAELTMGWERGRSLAPRRALAVPQKKKMERGAWSV